MTEALPPTPDPAHLRREAAERVAAGGARYDQIGPGYGARRRPDPRIAAAVLRALGDARSVLNVGAGTGSYEPVDRAVTAIEPSIAMALQRPSHLPPAVLAVAESLPLADQSVDAALGVLTVHHWTDRARGMAELRRVARRRVVLLTIDPEVEAAMWLFDEYAPQIVARDRRDLPSQTQLAVWLGVPLDVEVIPVPADCTDGFLLSFWSSPEAVLDPDARAATSGFARMDDADEQATVARLRGDLESGAWDRAHGHLRTRTELDVGLRLVVA